MNIENLVKKAQAGDKISFDKLYHQLAKKLYKFIFYKLQNKEDAEDVSLETWTQIVKSLKNYNASVQFNTWAYAIAKNCLNKFLQEKYEFQEFHSSTEIENISLKNNSKDSFEAETISQSHTEELLESSTHEQFIEETHIENESKLKIFEDKIAKLFKFLKPRDSKVLELRFLKGYKTEEVAKELDLSVSNVKIIQLRSIQKLKKLNFDEL